MRQPSALSQEITSAGASSVVSSISALRWVICRHFSCASAPVASESSPIQTSDGCSRSEEWVTHRRRSLVVESLGPPPPPMMKSRVSGVSAPLASSSSPT